MKTIIDETASEVIVQSDGRESRHPLASAEGFAAASRAWVRAGWDTKYVYSFSWFGRPLIQLPDDVLRIQEVIWSIKPDVIIETGVAHGGSLVFSASMLELIGEPGLVVGIDIDIRKHNRLAIESHLTMSKRIKLLEGSSISPDILAAVRELAKGKRKVLVILDSNHTPHVLEELKLYSPLVTPGSYLIVEDSNINGHPVLPVAQWSR